MKKFLLLFIILAFFVLVPVAFLNYYVDPARAYHPEQTAQEIVEGFKQKKNVVARGANLDERIYKRVLVEQLYKKQEIDYLILGPSRVFMIDTATLHTNSILNLGVSAAQINDFLALYQICKDNNLIIKNLIIGCDPTMFNITDSRWQSIKTFYWKFLGKNEDEGVRLDLVENLFSVSYFQSSFKKLIRKIISPVKPISYTDIYINDYSTYHKDGSLSYGAEYRNRTVDEVEQEAGTWMHQTFKDGDIDYNCLSDLEYFISTLYADGVKVTFFYCPYHPTFYKRINNMNTIKEGRIILDKMAKKYGINVIGAFCPDETNNTKEDFYDAAHLRKEAVDKLFHDFINSKSE